MKVRKLGILAAAVAGVMLSATGVKAASIEIQGFSKVALTGANAGIFDYQYTMVLTGTSISGGGVSNQLLGTGSGHPSGASQTTGAASMMEFFDIAGSTTLVGGDGQISDFVANAAATTAGMGSWTLATPGINSPAGEVESAGGIYLDPFTDSSLPNVMWTYSGTDLGVTANLTLGVVHIYSTIGTTGVIAYGARDAKYSTDPNTNGVTEVNSDTPQGPAAVPSPAAAWAGLSTLSGLGLLGFMKKRRK